uniref:Uncharacterized protein n=1 Tax=Glossina palpalis gambiensis TaxID=67801 RepID=A0A1B0BMR4_9MUSC
MTFIFINTDSSPAILKMYICVYTTRTALHSAQERLPADSLLISHSRALACVNRLVGSSHSRSLAQVKRLVGSSSCIAVFVTDVMLSFATRKDRNRVDCFARTLVELSPICGKNCSKPTFINFTKPFSSPCLPSPSFSTSGNRRRESLMRFSNLSSSCIEMQSSLDVLPLTKPTYCVVKKGGMECHTILVFLFEVSNEQISEKPKSFKIFVLSGYQKVIGICEYQTIIITIT